MSNHQNDTLAYNKLKSLIEYRQFFERRYTQPPYNLYSTDWNFTDIRGNSLLHYASTLGSLENVKKALENNANINLQNDFAQVPLQLALENGYLNVAQYLYEKGADCSRIMLSSCKTDETKEWFRTKIYESLKQSYPHPDKGIAYTLLSNQFFKNTWLIDEKDILNRAVETNDLEFVSAVITSKNSDASYKKDNPKNRALMYSLLICAAENGHLNMIKFLQHNGANIDSSDIYSNTPLMMAIKNGHQKVIDYLLTQDRDINKQDSYKYTALSFAVMKGDFLTIEKLLEKGAIITKTNVDGEGLLHTAIKHNPAFIEKLLTITGVSALINKKNIYGYSPLDLAIQGQNEHIIKLFLSNSNWESLKKHPKYGVQPIPIEQKKVMQSMYYYLKSNYRDTTYFNKIGQCNGLSFLKSLYTALGKEKYYFDTIALIANWDGEESSLKKEFKDIPQAAYYKNLEELLEQWTNDIIWFQHTTLGEIDPIRYDDRLEQYRLIANDNGLTLCSLYQENSVYNNEDGETCQYKRTPTQLTELLSYLLRMPQNTIFEINGSKHTTSGYKNNENLLSYYDPNFEFVPENSFDFQENIQRILDYKYIALNHFENGELNCNINVYRLEKNTDKPDLKPFILFREMELPKSKEDALLFQKNSPNHFTPLHVAVITHCLSSFKRLIQDGFCDINGRDFLGRTVLQIAVDNNFSAALDLLLESPNFDHSSLDGFATQAYYDGKNESLENILNHPKTNDMTQLFLAAIEQSDFDLIKKLVINKKVTINKGYKNQFPLIEAFKQDESDIINFLLQEGADVTICPSSNLVKTPLCMAIQLELSCLPQVLATMKHIDQFDENGNAAIHYAANFLQADLIRELITQGAKVNLRNAQTKSILDIIEETFNPNKDNKNACLELLLPLYDFDLTSEKEKSQLHQYLIYGSTRSDELFEAMIKKCNKEIINTKLNNNNTLLHHLILEKQYNKIKLLLKAGIFVDAPFTTGNTVLMGLIKVQDYPKKYELISLLLEYKSDVKIKNNEGKSALDLVAESDDEQLKTLFQHYEINCFPTLKSLY